MKIDNSFQNAQFEYFYAQFQLRESEMTSKIEEFERSIIEKWDLSQFKDLNLRE